MVITPEEGWRTYHPKHCGNNNKDEDNSPITLNDKNQASSQKFRHQTPEEGQRTYCPKHCGNNNKDEDNSPITLNDKNQASSQKFTQLNLSSCKLFHTNIVLVCKQFFKNKILCSNSALTKFLY